MPNVESIFGSNQDSNNKNFTVESKTKTQYKKNKFPLIVGTSLVLGLSLVFIATFVFKGSSEDFILKTWASTKVSEKTIVNSISTTGLIELKNKDIIVSPQSSQVTNVYVNEGDFVTQGQILAQLSTEDLEWELYVNQMSYDEAIKNAQVNDLAYDFSIRQQDIAIKTAQRNYENALAELEKTQGLFDRSIASSSELASAKNAVADASDTYDLAQLTKERTIAEHALTISNRDADYTQKLKTINDLKKNISDCSIKANSSGKVYSLDVALGDRVNSYDQIATIANPQDMQVALDIAENRIAEVKLNDVVGVTIGDVKYQAHVTNIASSATSSSSSASTIRVTADFEKTPSTAIVGGSVSADVQIGLIENALVLPRGPFLSSGNYLVAYVLNSDGSASKKQVSFGISEGSTIQVVSGLDVGDEVITTSYQEYIHLAKIKLSK